MLTLVTGANTGKYFQLLRKNLNNVIKVSNEKNIEIQIIVYNLGMTNNEADEIKLFSYVTLKEFDFNKYPEHVSLEKYYGLNCNYAWKPIIIHEVCEKYGGMVHWMDSANLYSDFTNLIQILKENYIYTPISSGTIKEWTFPTCLNYMKGYKYQNYPPRGAGIFAVNYDIEWVKKFVKEWKELALIKECICPEGSNRNNHRQDQALLSILYYKYQEIYNFNMINYLVDLSIHNF